MSYVRQFNKTISLLEYVMTTFTDFSLDLFYDLDMANEYIKKFSPAEANFGRELIAFERAVHNPEVMQFRIGEHSFLWDETATHLGGAVYEYYDGEDIHRTDDYNCLLAFVLARFC